MLHRGTCRRCRTQPTSVADGSDMVIVTIFGLTRDPELAPGGHSYRDAAAPWMVITLAPDPQRWACPVGFTMPLSWARVKLRFPRIVT
ncbi:hypothetical protein Stsp02_31820 [Streptomyces sp. NBRC 14336]|nr:hypothetical protein Stsp02_31820 [Streptomyces sp. NBRC 14336]